MFDSYNLRAVTERVTQNVNVDITEKRAPTDESVRLLREMEAAARASIINSTRVSDTPVECVIHHMTDSLNCTEKFKVIYRLKGQKRTVDYEHDFLKTASDPLGQGNGSDARGQMALGLRDALAKDIATQLVGAHLDEAMRKSWNPLR